MSGVASAGLGNTITLDCASDITQTFAIVGGSSYGTLGTVGSDRKVRYTADDAYAGADSFTYRSTNATSDAAAATVTLDVKGRPTLTAARGAGVTETAYAPTRLLLLARDLRRRRQQPRGHERLRGTDHRRASADPAHGRATPEPARERGTPVTLLDVSPSARRDDPARRQSPSGPRPWAPTAPSPPSLAARPKPRRPRSSTPPSTARTRAAPSATTAWSASPSAPA